MNYWDGAALYRNSITFKYLFLNDKPIMFQNHCFQHSILWNSMNSMRCAGLRDSSRILQVSKFNCLSKLVKRSIPYIFSKCWLCSQEIHRCNLHVACTSYQIDAMVEFLRTEIGSQPEIYLRLTIIFASSAELL